MKPEQEARLGDLAEKLAEVFLVEADPDQWAGAGEIPAERSKEDRGDRQWDLKNANQLGLLLARSLELRQRLSVRPGSPDSTVPAYNPEDDIKRFEREAVKVLERVGRK